MDYFKVRELLDAVEIEQLQDLFRNLGLNNNSITRRELINILENELTNPTIMLPYLLSLDKISFDLIVDVINQGYVKLKHDNHIPYYNALVNFGILFKIQDNEIPYYTISREIQKVFQKYIDSIQSEFDDNHLILKFGKASIAYYGLLTIEEIKYLFQLYHSDLDIDVIQKLKYLSCTQTEMKFNSHFLYDISIDNIEGFLKDREYFSFLALHEYSLEEFYLEDNFISIGTDFEFYEILTQYFKEELHCDPSILISIYFYFMYSPNIPKLVEILQKEVPLKSEQFDKKFLTHLSNYYQTVRCWVLKGYRVEDVNNLIMKDPFLYIESDYVKLKKVNLPSPNDRCPCGSGKKYKHCCIKKRV